jgi:chemotaxis protein CheD
MRTRPVDVNLQPGEYFVGGPGHRVRTLLGSCVSVTLWHPPTQVGAMSHFVLWSRGNAQPLAAADARYGDEAMQLMARGLAGRGVVAAQCEAKILGGGNMFPEQTLSMGRAPTVGERNGHSARELLAELGIRVVSENLFGIGHRQIVFDIHTGAVWVRHVEPVAATPRKERLA